MTNDNALRYAAGPAGDRRLVTVRPVAGGLAATEEPLPAGWPGDGSIVIGGSFASLGGDPVDDPFAQLTYAGPTADRLHDDLVARGHVDDRAPTQAAGEIRVAAAPGRVWAVLADVANWPAVRGDITDVRTDGPAAPGGGFTWRTGPNAITSRWGVVEPGERLTWSSVAPGARIAHVYTVHADGAGTVLACRESLAAPVLARLLSSAVLQAGVDSWLAGVKAVAEAPVR